MKISLFIAVVMLTFAAQISAQKTSRIAFYNVENLFDTIDNPNDDAEFLPGSKSEWNTQKYQAKLGHIREVLLAMNKPIIAGFSEIENAGVVRDIIRNQKAFKNYGLVHYESPDARGIDVALIYDSSKLKLLQSNHLRFNLPGEDKATTRDILWAQFGYKKSSFYVMVNHWPSRRSGTDESDAKRVAAAQVAAHFIDSINGLRNPINALSIPLQNPILDHVTPDGCSVTVEFGDNRIEVLLGVSGGGGELLSDSAKDGDPLGRFSGN